jgi:hypothetical protein
VHPRHAASLALRGSRVLILVHLHPDAQPLHEQGRVQECPLFEALRLLLPLRHQDPERHAELGGEVDPHLSQELGEFDFGALHLSGGSADLLGVAGAIEVDPQLFLDLELAEAGGDWARELEDAQVGGPACEAGWLQAHSIIFGSLLAAFLVSKLSQRSRNIERQAIRNASSIR